MHRCSFFFYLLWGYWKYFSQARAETSDQEISADLPGKKRQGKKEKGVKIEKKRRKIVKGKVENWKWKVEKLKNEKKKWGEDFFFCFVFVFCFPLFKKTTKISFGSTKMEIFYREKVFHAWKKIRKNDFATSEKFSCYALHCSYI